MPLADVKRQHSFREEPMKKRIRLTVEWDGACSERDWAKVLREEIEGCDVSRCTRVTKIEHLTSIGWTGPIELTRWRRFRRWFSHHADTLAIAVLVALMAAFAIAMTGR